MQPISDLVETLELGTPGSVAEAAALAACLAVGFACYLRSAGLAAGLLLTVGSLAAFAQIGHVSVPAAVAASGLLTWVAAERRGRTIVRPSWAKFGGEFGLVLGVFALYELGRIATRADGASAMANGRDVVNLEKHLHLFSEAQTQDFILRSEALTRLLNLIYSHGFLAVTTGVLLWLYFTDQTRYRLFRNCLAISALLAVATIWAFPVAPPRLLPEAGLADTVVVLGNEHHFANEYAAIPSLHVGWMALAGYVLALSVTGRKRIAVAVVPGAIMLLTVIATGNHYWLDGLIGSAFALAPALILRRPSGPPHLRAVWARLVQRSPVESGMRTRVSTLCLGGLLFYLVAARVQDPGFTDFWGYLTAQTAITLLLLLAGEQIFARDGGLSWLTHFVVVASVYADVLGTDGDLYASIAEYDKVTHFAGVAAITAGTYDCLRALAARRGVGHSSARLWLSVSIGVLMGVGWEVYEYLGDVVFHTTRTQGTSDTGHDLVFDALGAITLGALLWRMEASGRVTEAVPESERVPLR